MDDSSGAAAGSARRPISGCVITFNESDRIDACLDSLAFCDELLVVDSNSTDDTRERALARRARVLTRPFDDFRRQKNYTVQQARHDWILFINADERVTPELRVAIEAERDRGFPGAAAYRFRRRNDYFGRFLEHGNASPDRVTRLFDRGKGRIDGGRVHESVRTLGTVRRLAGALEHFPYRSFDEHVDRVHRYARAMAEHDHERGRRATLLDVVLRPWWRFLRGYVIRLGFLDGWRGLIYAYVRIVYVREKYMRLWLLNRGYRVSRQDRAIGGHPADVRPARARRHGTRRRSV